MYLKLFLTFLILSPLSLFATTIASSQKNSLFKDEKKLEDNSQRQTEGGNPYLPDEEEMDSMQEYATVTYPETKITSEDEYSTEEKVYEKDNPYDDSSSVSKKVRVQIGAFSARGNAERFLKEQRGKDYKLDIVEKNQDRILYKVVITCNSLEAAQEIISSKEYNGAYIIH